MEYQTMFIDQKYIMKAYDGLSIDERKGIQPNPFDPIVLSKIGSESAFARVYRINRDWVAKINTFPSGHSKSLAIRNNFQRSKEIQQVLRTKPFLQPYIIVPSNMIHYVSGNDDIYIRFEPFSKGETMWDYFEKPELRQEICGHEEQIIEEVLRPIICSLYYLYKDIGFNHNDLHTGNIMIVKEGGHYIPKIMDFDLASTNTLPHFVWKSIAESKNVKDFNPSACDKEVNMWQWVQFHYSSLKDKTKPYPSPSVDIAMMCMYLLRLIDCYSSEKKCPKIRQFLSKCDEANYDISVIGPVLCNQ
jgi:serine/threonine protein kinase